MVFLFVLFLLVGCAAPPGEYDGMIVVNFNEQFFRISHHGNRIELVPITVEDTLKVLLDGQGY
jgi:hypothetical protein